MSKRPPNANPALREVPCCDWGFTALPVSFFLILIGIPLSYSIADGLALGFISYPIIKLFTGRGREAGWLSYVLAVVLVLYFVFVRGLMG